MLVVIVRVLFVLAMVAVGFVFGDALGEGKQLVGMLSFAGAALAIIAADAAFRHKNISVISAVFFGLLVGLVVAMLMAPVVDMYEWVSPRVRQGIKVGIAAVASYLAISLILQTRNDFRFIIPYIEFSKQEKGGRPLFVDTSAIVDGRIADLAETGLFDCPLIVPRFILRELQAIADSPEKLKRDRGRHGLDVLNRLQTMPQADVRIEDGPAAPGPDEGPDQLLVRMAAQRGGRIVTVDYNLNKVARLNDVPVLNVNDLANALKPSVLPGEEVEVAVLKPGQGEGQGVGYLDDGTMVVVEDGRDAIGSTVTLTVTNVLQKSSGRIIFGRIRGAARRPER